MFKTQTKHIPTFINLILPSSYIHKKNNILHLHLKMRKKRLLPYTMAYKHKIRSAAASNVFFSLDGITVASCRAVSQYRQENGNKIFKILNLCTIVFKYVQVNLKFLLI